METSPFPPDLPPDLSLPNIHAGRTLQERVNAAAEAILEQGLRPTVTRVRAALGGGSPNDITPALKHWKEVVLPSQGRTAALEKEGVGIPPIVADVVRELWSRALAAAAVEIRGGATRKKEAAQEEQLKLLRQEIGMLRDRLQREAQAYGELRAQSARHEVIAKDAISRATELEGRLSAAERDLGAALARGVQLQARLRDRNEPAATREKGPVRKSRKTAQSRIRRNSGLVRDSRTTRRQAGQKSRKSTRR